MQGGVAHVSSFIGDTSASFPHVNRLKLEVLHLEAKRQDYGPESKPLPVGSQGLCGTGFCAQGHTHHKRAPGSPALAWLVSTKRTHDSSECLQRG